MKIKILGLSFDANITDAITDKNITNLKEFNSSDSIRLCVPNFLKEKHSSELNTLIIKNPSVDVTLFIPWIEEEKMIELKIAGYFGIENNFDLILKN